MRTSSAALFSILLALPAQAPKSVDAPSGSLLVLSARGDGVQIYSCASQAGTMAWTLDGPQAKLLDAAGKVIGTHSAGPIWRLDDGSEVKGRLVASRASPDAASAAWLLLETVPGSASGKFAQVEYIRRAETHGGAAPKAGCATAQQAGVKVRMPYTAEYSFYTK